jgi:predicted dienelactone hydrolase
MRLRRAALFLCAIVALAAACSSSDDPAPPPTSTPVPVESYAARGPYAVGVTTVEMADVSRPTAPNGEFAGAPERRMKVEVWYPAAGASEAPEGRDVALDAGGGPYPLIVFAHGFGSFRRQSALYTRHLAGHGYVVASPDFPSSNFASPGGARLGAVTQQPADVSFIIDRMLAFNAEAGDRFAGAIDSERIGMTGHSLGGLTSLLTEYGPARDPRIKAFLPLSPPGCFLSADTVGDVNTPVMFLVGSEDLIVDPSSMRHVYDLARAPRYFVELRGGNHLGFADFDITDEQIAEQFLGTVVVSDTFLGDALAIAEEIRGSVGPCVTRSEPKGYEAISVDRQRELLRLFGALFFDAYLRDNAAAKALLRGGNLGAIAPEATIEFE